MIAHNAVAFFHDGISVCTHGVPEAGAGLKARRDRHLQQRHPRDRRRLHRGRRRRAQHPRDAQSRRQRRAHGPQRAADLRRPAYYIRNVVYNTPVALKFSNPAGVIVLPQHDHRGEPHGAARVERALPEQPVPRHGRADRHLRARRPDRVLDATTTTAIGRTAAAEFHYTWLGPQAGRDAWTTIGRRTRRSGSRRSRSLRRRPGRKRTASKIDYDIFESLASAGDAGLVASRARRIDAVDLNFRSEGGRQGRRRRRAAAERERRLRGQGARSRRLRSSGQPRRSTARGV